MSPSHIFEKHQIQQIENTFRKIYFAQKICCPDLRKLHLKTFIALAIKFQYAKIIASAIKRWRFSIPFQRTQNDEKWSIRSWVISLYMKIFNCAKLRKLRKFRKNLYDNLLRIFIAFICSTPMKFHFCLPICPGIALH